MVTADLLIKKGYFPIELVPSFKTESLARSLPNIEIKQDKSKSKCCLYSIPRAKYLVANLASQILYTRSSYVIYWKIIGVI